MLLLWLSVVSMIPFDICRLDSTARSTSTGGRKPTMDRIMDIGKVCPTYSLFHLNLMFSCLGACSCTHIHKCFYFA